MPTPLVILFWIWLAISVGIYLARLFKRGGSTSNDAAADATDDALDGTAELPLDSPDRWTTPDSEPGADADAASVADADPAQPAQPTATPVPAAPAAQEQAVVSELSPDVSLEPAVTAALAEQAVNAPAEASELPVAEVASRLEPLVDESHIEPSVLSAMSPTQRAALGTTAAATTGGLFDPQVRATVLDQVEFDHQPLRELLTGIKLPCELLPAFRAASNDHYAVFTTTSASPAEVAAQVAAELERLGFAVEPRPPAGARATRATSAVDVVVALVEETETEGSRVDVEFTSL